MPASSRSLRNLAYCSLKGLTRLGWPKDVPPISTSLPCRVLPPQLDLAVTAPQRQETLAQAGQTALAAANQYAELKAAHLNTARACSAQGLNFVPLVVESTGAWSQSASKILLLISRAVAARTNSDAAQLHAELLQELSVLLRSHHARAVLRRRAESSEQSHG